MTSQVVVMNRMAAAVASDSSVTMSSGNQILRSYPTAEKIFPLALPHRLAILHGGCTDLLRVPYGVLLSEWHRSLTTPLGRVSDYADSFSCWLEEQTGLFDDANQTNFLDWILRDYFLAVRKDILDACHGQDIDPEGWKSPEADELLTQVLTGRLEHLEQLATPPNLADVDTDAFLDAHRTAVDSALEWVFDDTPRSDAGDSLIRRIASTVVRVNEPFSTDAELVFVGFGESELFPASILLKIGGIVAGRLKSTNDPYTAVTTNDPAYISPYAQTEAMNTFLRGYHPDFLGAAHESLEAALNPPEPDDSKKTAGHDTSKHHEELEDRFEQLSWNEFVQPLVSTVSGLPSAELARMAESLVGLQVLRKLTRAEAETVGGPVDVATITRGEGFTWCRHKSLLKEVTHP